MDACDDAGATIVPEGRVCEITDLQTRSGGIGGDEVAAADPVRFLAVRFLSFMDRFGNEWTKGPSRTAGEAFEWDVQLRDGGHWNVSLEGHITH